MWVKELVIFNCKLKGPYSFYGEDNLFQENIDNFPGIYIWTIPYGKKFLINYIGITSRTIKIRNREHIRDQLSGMYAIYDSKEAKLGNEKIVWYGKYYEINKGKTIMSLFNELSG
jgi:hypothetical protein